MPTRKPNGFFTRDSIVAVLMIGVALVRLLVENRPDYQIFLASIGISSLLLLTTFLRWRRRALLRILAYSVLLLAMFWSRTEPGGVIVSILLVILMALIQDNDVDEVEIVADISAIFDIDIEEEPQ